MNQIQESHGKGVDKIKQKGNDFVKGKAPFK